MRKRIQGSRTAPCAHPGCRKTIREGSWNFASGLCVAHQPVVEDPVKPPREGVRKVTVQLMPTCSSLASAREVTLPALPWEAA
jgi:hypothetical protein